MIPSVEILLDVERIRLEDLEVALDNLLIEEYKEWEQAPVELREVVLYISLAGEKLGKYLETTKH